MTDVAASTTEPVAPIADPLVDSVVLDETLVDTTITDPIATPEPIADYTEFTYPEGAVVDAELLDEFKAAAKEAGLSQEQAQHLTDMGAKMAQKINASNQLAIEQQKKDWYESSKADKEFGGIKLNDNLAIASKAIDAFATPELKTLLNTTGLGDHPELIRAFYRAGKAMSEDNLLPGGKAPVGEKSLAERLYGNH